MVVPLHGQEDWMPILSGRPEFIAGSGPMLVIAPHPDDETLAAGGLIAAQRELGRKVTLIAVTDGENAYEDNDGLAVTRVKEQTGAAERLGIDRPNIVRLGLTDSGVTQEFGALLTGLTPYIIEGTHVLAPWPGDFHPDHEACGKAAQALAMATGAQLSFYFFWTWHRGTPELLRDLPMAALPLTAGQQRRKAEALAMHVSQLNHASGDPILHRQHLWPAQLPFEVYLPA